MKILIVGLGSIAAKHIKAIRMIRPEAEIVALRSGNNFSETEGVTNIFKWEEGPEDLDFIIISNPTQFHKEAINNALKFKCPLFIEKPLLSDANDGNVIHERLNDLNLLTYIACNLRFHPCLKFARDLLNKEKIRINEVNVYCGSDLSAWRPGQDYTKSYSAHAEMGGGVHLDLIHEMDYCYWLFGKPDEVSSLKRKVSDLKINSMDFAAYHLSYPGFTVNITLNYYRKKVKRSLEIVAEEGTYYIDLVKATVSRDEKIIFQDPEFKMEQTYLEQMQYFIGQIQQDQKMMNDFNEAMEVLKIATA